MIELESTKMQRAIAKSKTMKPRVRMIGERVYSVSGSRGNTYTVTFSVANGLKLGACTCPAGEAGQMCYHIAAAAAVNIAIQTMRKAAAQQAAPAPAVEPVATDERPALIASIKPIVNVRGAPHINDDDRAQLITDIKAAWQRIRPFASYAIALHQHFGVTRLEDVPTEGLREIHALLCPNAGAATATVPKPAAPRPRSSFVIVYRATADACARGERLPADSAGVRRVRSALSLAA